MRVLGKRIRLLVPTTGTTMRALKRRLSDVVYRQLTADAHRHSEDVSLA
jgi:hypothetical protein